MTGQSYNNYSNLMQSAQNYGAMVNPAELPLQYTKPSIIPSYAALNGHGMLDLPPNIGSDLLPDGYSVMQEDNIAT